MSRALLVLILLLGSAANVTHGDPGEGEKPQDRVTALTWVRTSDGWQRPDAWHQPPPWSPTLHPFVVAAGQLLGSLWALVAFNMSDRRQGEAQATR